MSTVTDAAGTQRLSCRRNTPAERRFFYRADGVVRQIGLAGDRLVEVVAEPQWDDFSDAAALIEGAGDISFWRVELFRETGRLSIEEPASIAVPASSHGSAPVTDDRIVCPCTNLRESQLLALFDQGLSVDDIAFETNAMKTCGGCKMDIEELGGLNSLEPATLISKETLDPMHMRFTFQTEAEEPVEYDGGNAAANLTIEACIDQRTVRRNYTLVDRDPERGTYAIIVRREANGLFSQWLHDYADEQTSFRVSAPHGGFAVDESADMVCIAGGVGITPALSLLQRARRVGVARVRVIWSTRLTGASRLVDEMRRLVESVEGASLVVWDSQTRGRLGATELRALAPPTPGACVHLCGPVTFMDSVDPVLKALGWHADDIFHENFYPRTSTHRIEKVDAFDYDTEACEASSFGLRPVASVMDEAEAFLKQFYYEHGAGQAFEARMQKVRDSIHDTGEYRHTFEELAYGARVAWRNTTRCIGRFFWRTLTVVDRRDARTEDEIFSAILSHIDKGTNNGDLRPVITVFDSLSEPIRIINAQLLLYAGYRQPDGGVIGDPKNIEITDYARSLGWQPKGGRFDILPLIIQIGGRPPQLFEIPQRNVLEVPISHPECNAVKALDLRWFALPAVSGMALDIGGIQYTAAPSNGFYMGTEIGSFNLAQADRYDALPDFAAALGIRTGDDNPMWKDQCVVEINRAVLHSFRERGVRILDHHSLAAYFERFRADEAQSGRTVYGHWPWIVPPISSNLAPVWHDKRMKNRILKPNYFYQDFPRSKETSSAGKIDFSKPVLQ